MGTFLLSTILSEQTGLFLKGRMVDQIHSPSLVVRRTINLFAVSDTILLCEQTQQKLQYMYEKREKFDA